MFKVIISIRIWFIDDYQVVRIKKYIYQIIFQPGIVKTLTSHKTSDPILAILTNFPGGGFPVQI